MACLIANPGKRWAAGLPQQAIRRSELRSRTGSFRRCPDDLRRLLIRKTYFAALFGSIRGARQVDLCSLRWFP